MAARIDLTFDPKQAKQGLAELEQALKKSGTALGALGNTEGIAQLEVAVKQTDTAMEQFGQTAEQVGTEMGVFGKSVELSQETLKKFEKEFAEAQRKLEEAKKKNSKNLQDNEKQAKSTAEQFGNLASVSGALGSALGGTSGQALSLASSLGGAGTAAVALYAIFESGRTIMDVTTNDIQRMEHSTTMLGMASEWLAKQLQSLGLDLRQAVDFIDDLEQRDQEFHDGTKRRFEEQQKRLAQAFEARQEFVKAEAEILRQLDDERIVESTANLNLKQVREELLRLAEREQQILEAGKAITDETRDIEGTRNRLLEERRQLLVRMNALQQRGAELVEQQKRAAEEMRRSEEQRLQQLRQLQEQAHQERMRQIAEEEMRKRAILDADVAGIQRLLRERQQAERGFAMGVGGTAVTLAGEERRQARPDPFARFNLASGLQARQEAMVRSPAQLAASFGNAQRHARGDFSMDHDEATVRQLRGGVAPGLAAQALGPGAMASGGGADTLTGMLQEQIPQREILDRIVQQRIAEAGATGRAARGIRARTFKGIDEPSEAEIGAAVREIATARAQSARAAGEIGQRTLEAMQEMLKLEAEQQQEQQDLAQRLSQIEAIISQQGQRKKAIKAGRGRL